MCEGGKKKHCSRINDRISEILIVNAVWNTFSSSQKPVLVSPLKFAPPPSCGWTLLTRQPLIVHLLILRWDWQMKDSVLTGNLSILMWPPVQWKVERARMLRGGGGGLTSLVTYTNTWAAIMLDHIQLFLCNSVNYFSIICQYEL